MTAVARADRASRPSGTWRGPAALIALGAVPVAVGIYRVATLVSGAEVTPDNARFFADPIPVILHVTGSALFLVGGAIQFVPHLRRRASGWHRRAGRVLVGAGLVAAISGLWMTLFYELPAHDQGLLHVFRLGFGSAMAVSIVLGFAAIRRRDVRRHRAWMIRGYAIGLGAGTQLFTLVAGELVVGPPGTLARALLMAAGWSINLVVAEWIIRGRPIPTTRASDPLSVEPRGG